MSILEQPLLWSMVALYFTVGTSILSGLVYSKPVSHVYECVVIFLWAAAWNLLWPLLLVGIFAINTYGRLRSSRTGRQRNEREVDLRRRQEPGVKRRDEEPLVDINDMTQ